MQLILGFDALFVRCFFLDPMGFITIKSPFGILFVYFPLASNKQIQVFDLVCDDQSRSHDLQIGESIESFIVRQSGPFQLATLGSFQKRLVSWLAWG